MLPIFNRQGVVVGWVRDGRVLDQSSTYRAFVHHKGVFSYDRGYLGTFDRGYFRDRFGHAVAFVKGARGGPIPPITQIPPIAPIPPIPPIPPVPPIPPIAPIPTLNWSALSWDQFLAGG
jgi:hypothetical protein